MGFTLNTYTMDKLYGPEKKFLSVKFGQEPELKSYDSLLDTWPKWHEASVIFHNDQRYRYIRVFTDNNLDYDLLPVTEETLKIFNPVG